MTDDTLQVALVDRYVLERELGRGGMATVYLARDVKHDRLVALKVLHADFAAPLAPERFQREIRFVARLQHPHILPVFDSGAAGATGGRAEYLWFTMPYVEGESLRNRLRRETRLPVTDAVRIANQVARALAYAHGQGLIHRDIKPENILLTRDGDCLVADFGLGRALAERSEGPDGDTDVHLTGLGAAMGTPAYMSLEQADGDRALDGRSDIYSLGVMLYEMLAGERPFAGKTPAAIVARQLTETPRPIRSLREEVSPALDGVILKMIARDRADRYASAREVAEALESERLSSAPPTSAIEKTTRTWGRWAAGALAIVAAVALAGGVVRWRASSPPNLASSVVAVAPFDVLDPTFGLWREGLVDLLSRSLDGAGPLRAVSPTTVIRRWKGRADPTGASALAQRTGAGLILFGTVVGAGADSVRLRATLFDATTDRSLFDLEVGDVASRIDRAADSLAVRLLRELGRSRPVGAWRRIGFGTTNPPALKAFLRGEQLLRRTAWDSALSAYESAIEMDTAFALALSRAGQVLGWTRGGFDSLADAYARRASQHIQGLAARDSILLVADSLSWSLWEAGPLARNADVHWLARLRRLVATLDAAARQWPDDAQVWYSIGEWRTHFGPFIGSTRAEILEAFDRSLALDSSFAPSYLHPVEYSGQDGSDAVRRYLRPYLTLAPLGGPAGGYRLLDLLLDTARVTTATDAILDTMSGDALFQTWQAVSRWPDSAETHVRLARVIAARPVLPAGVPPDPTFWRGQIALSLMNRGHLREAGRTIPPILSLAFVEAVRLGAVSPARAAPVFAAAFAAPTAEPLTLAIPWWGGQRDTTSLMAAARRGDSIAGADPGVDERGRGRYVAAAAAAYLALARGDSVGAAARFDALPDSLCPSCYQDRLTHATLLAVLDRDRDAARLLQRDLPTVTLTVFPSELLWVLLRGRMAERMGDRQTARDSYAWPAAMWRHADPELQNYVAEARDGIARLTAEH